MRGLGFSKSAAAFKFKLTRTHRRLAARQELSKKTLLGSADMRIWVVQREDPGLTSTGSSFPSAPSSPAKLLHNLSSTLDADCLTKLGPTKAGSTSTPFLTMYYSKHHDTILVQA